MRISEWFRDGFRRARLLSHLSLSRLLATQTEYRSIRRLFERKTRKQSIILAVVSHGVLCVLLL